MVSINPPLIAHRGASALAPENTLAAFRMAHALGATWVEFDVMLAACGEVVVIHDETLDRTTNGRGRVCDYPYSYLCTLDAGSWFSSDFANEKIPTLAEVLLLLQELQLTANIEIKAPSQHIEQTVAKTAALIEKNYHKNKILPLISSFSTPALFQMRQTMPTSQLGFLMDEWLSDWQKSCDNLNCVTVNVNEHLLTQARVSEIKSTQRMLLAYTVDDPVRARELFSWGVDGIFSNCSKKMQIFML